MDFLTHLSVRYAHGHVCDEEADTEDDDAPLIGQMNKMLKPINKVGTQQYSEFKKSLLFLLRRESC